MSSYNVKPNPIFNAHLQGTHEATIPAGQTVEIDWVAPKQYVLNGCQYQTNLRTIGDKIDFEVHHPDLGLLLQFGENWFVLENDTIVLPYSADIPAGLIIKVRYTNTGLDDTHFCLGLFLHEYIV